MPVITLLTDFGLRDSFVGVMKGVIWGICPQVQIADISHEITPRGNQLVTTDQAAVTPGNGMPALVEFFRLT